MNQHLLTGNEAIARGAYEAGVQLASAYPGTPSTEILENMPQYKDALYCEWAPNEKVAAEVAYGAAVAGIRSICAQKHVGLNVAADPVLTAAYNGVNGGYVVVVADDPNMHSSQNEQDSRYYAKFANVALVEPSDSQECIDFLKESYEISEKYDMPVLFRTTTRVSHSKSIVTFQDRKEVAHKSYERNTHKNVCVPANAIHNHPKVLKNMEALEEYGYSSPLNKVEMKGTKVGVITASIAYQYAKDAFDEDTSFLKLGLTNPLPMKLIKEFADKVDELYVIEELEGYMEEQIKAAGIDCKGKDLIGRLYELNPQLISERVFGKAPEVVQVDVEAVSRPATLCPGCPHRGFFYTMSKGKDFVVTGDIGCYTLGAAAPLEAMDTCICMGGGFTVGMGMSKAFELTKQENKKVFGVMGDSTFFHSGMTGAAEIIYNKGNVIPVILDNHITGMTGQQDNPASGYTLQGEVADAIDIEGVMRACGYTNVLTVDPLDLDAMQAAVDNALESSEPSCIITKRPCVLIKRIKRDDKMCVVDADKCISCKKCLKVGCAAIMMKDGKSAIDRTQCIGCTVCAQVCPVDAIYTED